MNATNERELTLAAFGKCITIAMTGTLAGGVSGACLLARSGWWNMLPAVTLFLLAVWTCFLRCNGDVQRSGALMAAGSMVIVNVTLLILIADYPNDCYGMLAVNLPLVYFLFRAANRRQWVGTVILTSAMIAMFVYMGIFLLAKEGGLD